MLVAKELGVFPDPSLPMLSWFGRGMLGWGSSSLASWPSPWAAEALMALIGGGSLS